MKKFKTTFLVDQALIKSDMLENSFRWDIDYNYNSSSSCEESGCDDEGICRCSTIDETWVTEVNLNQLVTKMMNFLAPDGVSKKRQDRLNLLFNDGPIEEYGIYRLCVIHQLYRKDLYEIEIEGGYYGDEIGEITLDKAVFQAWLADCLTYWNLETITEKINFLIFKEYGDTKYIEGLTPSLIYITAADLDWKGVNPAHQKKVLEKDCSFYGSSEYKLPRGLVRAVGGGKYQVIDGYHRLLNAWRMDTIKHPGSPQNEVSVYLMS